MQQLETEAVERIADLHAESFLGVAPTQRGIEQFVAMLGKPRSAGAILVAVGVWIALNVRLGPHAFDPPPFSLLQAISSVAALLMTVLILTAENRRTEADLRRARLTLQIAMLAETKTAKIIGLLERMRVESPVHSSEPDPEASAMAEPSDPNRLMRTIDEAHERAKADAQRRP